MDYFDAKFWRKSDQSARLDALLEVGLGGLRIAAQHGFSTAFLRYFAVVQDTGTACGLAYAEARPVTVADVAHSTVFTQPDTVTMMLNADVSAVISVPMCGPSGHLVGVLSAHYPRPNRITERDRRVLSLLSASAAHRLTDHHDG
ncbi:GAF domain-containing protein [Paractinoplanes atraurantiacus]|uniref:GAF domain-containing protein n=1 Tax=Paractinoplanes atraurantiacus TaxID=1036182 RepID=A0A285HKA0_9ACTN|nr:GAF domain-containing protein [Actinoplanes atraurantiacus]SNY35121.1 GAF domain-containing protein [Actinoplanes atraurantiacus]